MANRSYLYALSSQPTQYADRPETITGLSEWPYDVPLAYYILLSGNPRLCASLVSDGFENDSPDNRTRLYAITGDFETGLARFERFAAVVRRAAPDTSTLLRDSLAEAADFLTNHRNRYFLLETIELDCMSAADGAALQEAAQKHVAAAWAAGAAVDALSRFDFMATRQFRRAIADGRDSLAPFKGLSLADDFDHRDKDRIMGVGFWTTILYFALEDRQAFEERHRTGDGLQ